MAALTRAQLTTQLRERLGEATASAWTDTELQNWLNEGVKDIAIRTECCMYRAEVIVDDGVYLINFPSWNTSDAINVIEEDGNTVGTVSSTGPQVIRIARCEWVDDTTENFTALSAALVSDALGNTYDVDKQVYPLEYRSLSSMDAIRGTGQQTIEGIPNTYSLWGQSGNIKIVLYPKPSTTGHLRVYFYAIPEAMDGDSDTTKLPVGWENLVLDYAQYKAQLRDSNGNWQAAKQEYEMHIGMYTAQFKRLTTHNEPIETDAFWHEFDEWGYY